MLRVDLVLRVINGVLVAVIVHSILICIPNSLHISHRENGSFEVLSLHVHEVQDGPDVTTRKSETAETGFRQGARRPSGSRCLW